MKCRNCGSELNNGRCEQCGFIYGGEISQISIPMPDDSDSAEQTDAEDQKA